MYALTLSPGCSCNAIAPARAGTLDGEVQLGAVASTILERMPQGLPCGHRTPRGALRWYLVQAPEGRELSTCSKVRSIIDPAALDSAFVLFKERWFRRGTTWSLQPAQMFQGYFFAATRDVIALDRALKTLSFPAQIVGTRGHTLTPLATEAQKWFARSVDSFHVLRNSTASIVDGVLHVKHGPLVGQESRILKVDRHKRSCLVHICDADGGFALQMPIDIPFKS